MSGEREQLLEAIEAQEKLRGAVADEVVDATIAVLRDRLAVLDRSPADQKRRLATVLFADVHGFTTMSETLDPELVADRMNDLWARLDAIVVEHGGRVDKHIGDALMAVWGADRASEDDAERAVRAALALQVAMAAFTAANDTALGVRVGLHTGPVVVGAMGTDAEATVMGDTVNVANRMESASPVGGVLISAATYTQVRGLFDVRATAPLTLKGKTEPMQAYIVERSTPRAFRMATRGIEGVDTRMIGRGAELDALESAFAVVARDHRAATRLVIGEPGVGKSRLLIEFDAALEPRSEPFLVLKGRAWPSSERTPYSLFRDLLARQFDVLESDTPDVALAKFRDGVVASHRDHADIVGHWIGFDFSHSPAVQRLAGMAEFGTVARAHLSHYLRALALQQPLVVLFEDLHWADDSSLDLIEHLETELRDTPVLIVAAARPAVFERRPAWRDRYRVDSMPLTALDDESTRALISEILQHPAAVPESLITTITANADGNPFFVEELVKMLADEGALVAGTGADGATWTVDEDRLAALHIPPTVTGVLQARLDFLPDRERSVLQHASIVGRVFWDGAVNAVLADASNLDEDLEGISRRDLVYRRERSTFAATGEFIFKHALLRDVAYETVLLRDRPKLHERAAQWLERNARERIVEYLGVIADHYALAGEHQRAGDLWGQLGETALRHGNVLAARRALDDALEAFDRARDRDDTRATAVEARLGEALLHLGEFGAAETATRAALDAARASARPEVEISALCNLGRISFARAEYDGAEVALEAALLRAREQHSEQLGRVLNLLSSNCPNAPLSARRSWAEESYAIALEAADTSTQSQALSALGVIAGVADDLEAAEQYFSTAADLALECGNTFSEAVAIANLAVIAHLRGDASGSFEQYRTAAAMYDRAVSRWRELGLQDRLAGELSNIAQLNVRMRAPEPARRALLEALTIARDLDSTRSIVFLLMFGAEYYVLIGERARAFSVLRGLEFHPACDAETRIELDHIVERLAPTPEEALALRQPEAVDIDQRAAEMLAQLA